MATQGHFAKFKGLRPTTKHSSLHQTYMEKMIVRQPVLKSENLHPAAKQRYNEMLQ